MKQYLREIELAGVILVVIGIVMSAIWSSLYGVWPCAVGMLLWLASFLYKSFHWQTYAAENKRNIVIVLCTILILLLQLIIRR